MRSRARRPDGASTRAVATSLGAYLSAVAPGLRRALAADARLGAGRGLGNLRPALPAAEQSERFRSLCSTCNAHVTFAPSRFATSSVTPQTWANALGAYLRNTGAYLLVARSEDVQTDSLAAAFVEEAVRTEHTVTHYAMLEGVDLGQGAAEVAWERHRLVYVSPASLDHVLGIQTRSLFFDDGPDDLHRLTHHWFATASEVVAVGLKGVFRRIERHLPRRLAVYPTEFLAPVEDALTTLALYDWQPEWAEDDRRRAVAKQLGWMGFRVPVVFETGGDPLSWPRRIPDTSHILMRTVIGRDGEEMVVPEQSFLELGGEEIARLQAFLVEAQAYRDGLPATSSAEFLRVAMNALLKALLSDGMEQLLWHIIAIEAVLGGRKRGESTTSLLARRLGNILATTDCARDELDGAFRELYDFRCALVHGSPCGRDAFRGHLRVSRDLALPVVLWALRTFARLQEDAMVAESPAADRKDLLRIADLQV